jgi:hypothetical protein
LSLGIDNLSGVLIFKNAQHFLKILVKGGDTSPLFALKLHYKVNLDPTTTFCKKILLVSKTFAIKNSLQSAFFDSFSLISPKIANALLQIHNTIPVCRA